MQIRAEPELVYPASRCGVKLSVPVGLVPRVRCATSDTCPPAATEPLAVVVSAGLAFVTTTASAGSAQAVGPAARSEEHTSELQSRLHLVCRLLLEKKKKSSVG